MKNFIPVLAVLVFVTGCNLNADHALKTLDVSNYTVKPEITFSNIELRNIDFIKKNSLSGCSDKSLIEDCLSLMEINKLKKFSKKVFALSNAKAYEKHVNYKDVANDDYKADTIAQYKDSFKNDEILVSELKDYIDYLKSIYSLNNEFNSAIKALDATEQSKMIDLLDLNKDELNENNKTFKAILNLIKAVSSSETTEQKNIREKNNYFVKKAITEVLNLRIDKTKTEVTDAISTIKNKP